METARLWFDWSDSAETLDEIRALHHDGLVQQEHVLPRLVAREDV